MRFSVSASPKRVTPSARCEPTEMMFLAVAGGWTWIGRGVFGLSSDAVPSKRSGTVGVTSWTRESPRDPPLLPTGETIMKSRLL